LSAKALDPLDLYNVRSDLSEDEVMVKDSVARLVDDRVIPVMQEAFERHEFPRHLVSEVAELGLLGSSIEGYDCAGLNSVSYGLICQELERGDSGLRSFVSVQSSLVMFPIHAYGSEEQKQRWLPAMPRKHENARQTRRRRLDYQWLKNVDYQCADCRCVGGLGND
jgi:glutaryl-CoA dehydrogenase